MKNMIISIALTLLLVVMLIFNSDFGMYIAVQEDMKSTAELCMSGAIRFIDEQEYGEGYYVFKDSDAIQYVSLLAGTSDYTLYLFDDQCYMRVYQRSGGEPVRLIDSGAFTYGSRFTDIYGKETVIDRPSIAVILQSDRFGFRQGFSSKNARSSMYVVEGR